MVRVQPGFLKSLTTTNRIPSYPADSNWVAYAGDGVHGAVPGTPVDATWEIGDPPFLAAARSGLHRLQMKPAFAANLATALTNDAQPTDATKAFQRVQDGYAAQGKLIWSGPPFPGPNLTGWRQRDFLGFDPAVAIRASCRS